MNPDRIIAAFSTLAKVLEEEKVIKTKKWHTIEFYAKRQKGNQSGIWLDSIRVSSIKRKLIGNLIGFQSHFVEENPNE